MIDPFRKQVIDTILQKRPDCTADVYDQYLNYLEIDPHLLRRRGWSAEEIAAWVVDTFRGPPIQDLAARATVLG
jgi:hypothetical protein